MSSSPAPQVPSSPAAHSTKPAPDLASFPSSDELAQMISETASGNATEFARLYAATSARIYGLVLRVLCCPDQAAEVTQEVYLQVWRQASRFDPARGHSMSWLTVMAHRRAVDRVRTVCASTTRDDAFATDHAAQEFDEVWEDVARRSEAATVREALNGLSALQRQAIVLTYFGGHTASRAAALLDVPVGTVKTRIRDGMINLRRSMAPA